MKTKKQKSKFIKIVKAAAVLVAICLFILIGSFSILYFTGDKVRFDKSKFHQAVSKIDFYDNQNKIIEENNSYNISFIKLDVLSNHTKDAFISIEDKEFYNHSGLNYKRILKAFLLDVKNMNLAQGASTISQQLIKNTHLSSQKTLSRKVNEIVLTKELETKLSKEQILENYLNIIYFGDNCYGIENASWHYFKKSAKDLSLEESAVLAGMISSPATYSPISKPENAIKRRNIVLKEMLKDKKITNDEYLAAKDAPLTLDVQENNENLLNTYTEAALDQAMEILKLPAKQISLGEYKIYTHFDLKKQKALEESLLQSDFQDNNFAAISISSKTGNVEAFYGNGNYKILKVPRQPASVIKPLIVYGPAMNENIISPQTHILDEEISISGYKPQNFNFQYHGYISTEEAISKSLNIPAVKVASYLGLDKVVDYGKKVGIKFDENDKNYSAVLGGFTHGTTLDKLTGAYTSFSNNGEYVAPSFINYITDKDGKIVYISKNERKKVFREDTSYLMNKMLVEASKTGTSQKLAPLNYEVASKTGTVGKANINLDAVAVSYTTEDIVGVWVGNFDNSPIGRIVGGTIPVEATKNYFENIYKEKTPENFYKPDTIQTVEIDLKHLEENHQIIMANNFLPDKYKQSYEFSSFNLPKISNINYLSLAPSQIDGKVENSYAVIEFDAKDFLKYELYLNNNLIETFENVSKKQVYKYYLTNNKPHSFTLITKIKNYKTGEEIEEKSNTIRLVKTNQNNLNASTTTPKKWYLNFA